MVQDNSEQYCLIVTTLLPWVTGPHSWMMPTVELKYPNKVEMYRWFAKALLEGEVAKKLKKLAPKYLASPSIMVKSWAR